MFYLASAKSAGLVIKSKVSSTKGGVTGGSKSYVCRVRLVDFTVLAVNGGMEQVGLGEKKNKSSHSTTSSCFCEKGAIILGLL